MCSGAPKPIQTFDFQNSPCLSLLNSSLILSHLPSLSLGRSSSSLLCFHQADMTVPSSGLYLDVPPAALLRVAALLCRTQLWLHSILNPCIVSKYHSQTHNHHCNLMLSCSLSLSFHSVEFYKEKYLVCHCTSNTCNMYGPYRYLMNSYLIKYMNEWINEWILYSFILICLDQFLLHL